MKDNEKDKTRKISSGPCGFSFKEWEGLCKGACSLLNEKKDLKTFCQQMYFNLQPRPRRNDK